MYNVYRYYINCTYVSDSEKKYYNNHIKISNIEEM